MFNPSPTRVGCDLSIAKAIIVFRRRELAPKKSLAFPLRDGPQIAPRILRIPSISYTALIQGTRSFISNGFRKAFLSIELMTRHPYPFAKQQENKAPKPVQLSVLQGMLSLAFRHHQAGRLAEAERIYRRILALDSRQADTLHLLGMIAYQTGRQEAAVEMFQKAIAINAGKASYHSDLGVALQAQGRLNEAAACYERALSLKPNFAEAHGNLGNIHHAQGRLDEAVARHELAVSLNPKLPESHFNLGNCLQDKYKLAEAAACYERALALKPDYAEAWCNLGSTRKAQGKLDEAVACYRRQLALQPNSDGAFYNLGNALLAQGKSDEAVKSYERALALNPDFAEAHGNLGNLLHVMGKLHEAEAHHLRALALKPSFPESHYNLGNALQDQDKLEAAVASYERALALKPDYAEAWCNLGNARKTQGMLEEAAACFERALTLKPNFAEAHANLGTTLQAQGKLDEAVAHHERALALRPNLPDSHYNLGNALQDQDKLEEAVACYERALSLKPDFAKAHYNLGCARHASGHLEEALLYYKRAQIFQPDFAQASFSESLALLSLGDFADGWRKYESRWKTKEHVTRMRTYAQPLWKGEKLAPDGRLLIWNEQGVGDEIMFAGFIPDVIRTGNRCVLDCDARLNPLFARSFPGIEIVSTGNPDPEHPPMLDFAAHLPSGSLPGLFRTTHAAFAATASPYLAADPLETEKFRASYADGKRLAGLSWYTKNRKTGRHRSIDLSLFAPWFARPDIRWISLQYGDHDELEKQAAQAGAPILIDRSIDPLSDIDRFAAQVAAMDLVVTIDNSTAHLAGALGVPTWVLLPFAPDWRWLLARDDSPWYPSLRLFRQPKLGDWPAVIQKVLSAL